MSFKLSLLFLDVCIFPSWIFGLSLVTVILD
jgi:hypothetical protein